MTQDELINGVNDFFTRDYSITNGTVVPDVDDIPLGKNGKEIELAMLFIDIDNSTKITDGLRRVTAAKVYKSFLWGVSKIALNNNGELRSFNGDGLLVAFVGDSKCTNAAKAALNMNWFVLYVLKPKIQEYIDSNSSLTGLDFTCGIGIDVGKVLVVRGGIRGENNNDLVWVGNPTNYAVKLAKQEEKTIFISEQVYTSMNTTSKYEDPDTKTTDMWHRYTWTEMDGETIYGSDWHWAI